MFNATLSSIVCGRMAKIDFIPKTHSYSFFYSFYIRSKFKLRFCLVRLKLVGVHSAFARTCDRFSCLTTREVAFPPSPSRLCALHLIEMFLLGHRSNSVNACLRSWESQIKVFRVTVRKYQDVSWQSTGMSPCVPTTPPTLVWSWKDSQLVPKVLHGNRGNKLLYSASSRIDLQLCPKPLHS